MTLINNILNYTFHISKDIQLNLKTILFIIIIFTTTTLLLKTVRRVVNKRLETEDRDKFSSVFMFFKYFIFLIITFLTLDNIGINVTGILAGATALLIGIGLALQTLFQDIICGIFVILDKTVHVGDIIEIEGKIMRVTHISLRTTRGLNIQNKVLIIPNHLYLTNTLYNWTQNNPVTREEVSVGVAYGSDTRLVERLLIQAANETKGVIAIPEPTVYFKQFGDSSLDFRLVFTVDDSFQAIRPKSNLHFKIDELFRKHKITIPFPQRDVHLFNH